MKNSFVIIVCLFISNLSFAQSGEFEVYPNGLIYSQTTMDQLSHIVDSLNLKYKTCDLNKTYYSKAQTIGYFMKLKKGKVQQAKKDIGNQIGFEAFVAKYPDAEIRKDILIVKYTYRNYQDEEVVEFSEIDLGGDYGYNMGFSDNLELYEKDLKNNWLYDYNEKSEYYDESIYAFYFPNSFTSKPIKEKYARLIAYADCLIDTTASKLKNDLEDGWVELPKNWTKLSKKKQEKLLDKMRSTRVVGFCSQDSRPRDHAVNIAKLSAETTNWEVFLKAHLDIMNDRFERAIDGSYAWAQRNTYIKELELLDINVSDLIFGISFRIENPDENHYYGSIRRIGRALTETQNREAIEKNILSAIEDPELDDYNRTLFYFLFLAVQKRHMHFTKMRK